MQQVGELLVAQSVAAQEPLQVQLPRAGRPEDGQRLRAARRPDLHHRGLLRQLKTEAELAGVLGHEIGHVIARHSSERLAKQQLTQGLLGALVVGSGDYTHARRSARWSAA